MKKIFKIAGIVFGVAFIIIVACLGLMGGAIIKGSVNTIGPVVLGVPVTLHDAVFSPFRGKIRLTGLHVGNPEGFKTQSLFDLGDVDIELDSASLLSNTILIHKILVDRPEITYERGLLNSNFGKLLDQLQGSPPKSGEAEKPQPKADKGGNGKKVVIESLIVRDPKLKLSLTAAGGHSLSVALGQVELKDIGKEKGGVTMADALKIIFSVITSNVENAVKGAGDVASSSAKAIGKGAATALKSVGGLVGLEHKKAETNNIKEAP